MTRIASLDPGLATFGIVIADAELLQEPSGRWVNSVVNVVRCDVFTSEPRTGTDDDLTRRASELSVWLARHLEWANPDIIAAEAMSFPQGHDAVVCIALAWGVIAAELARRVVPVVTVYPTTWRTYLIGAAGGAIRGGTKEERKRRTQEREDAAHAVAVRRVPSFVRRARLIRPTRLQPHVLDALGVLVWALGVEFVRNMIGGTRG